MYRSLAWSLVCSLMLSGVAVAEDFKTIFDGKTLDGWKVTENKESIKVVDGAIVAKGNRSHAFYVGDDKPFKNFEFECEVMTLENSNGGIFFHTKVQEEGWPQQGHECQVNNTFERDPRKTASVYRAKDVLEAPAKDNEWFTYNIKVVDRKVTVTINGKVANEYEEAADKAGPMHISEGTFALQAHDPGSTVKYRNIRVKRID